MTYAVSRYMLYLSILLISSVQITTYIYYSYHKDAYIYIPVIISGIFMSMLSGISHSVIDYPTNKIISPLYYVAMAIISIVIVGLNIAIIVHDSDVIRYMSIAIIGVYTAIVIHISTYMATRYREKRVVQHRVVFSNPDTWSNDDDPLLESQ